MSKEQILVIFGILLVIYIIASWYGNSYKTEAFSTYGNRSGIEMQQPYDGSSINNPFPHGPTAGIENYLVDNMVCSKKCCGDQWPVPFEGLTSAEVEQTITTLKNSGPFVRTNYTCANGIEGVGCPCINKNAYKFLVNKGHNSKTIQEIEPTFLIRGNEGIQGIQDNYMLSPYESLQSERSMFVDSPLLNDLELRRMPNPVTQVVSCNTPEIN